MPAIFILAPSAYRAGATSEAGVPTQRLPTTVPITLVWTETMEPMASASRGHSCRTGRTVSTCRRVASAPNLQARRHRLGSGRT